jgi:hypothetical protein
VHGTKRTAGRPAHLVASEILIGLGDHERALDILSVAHAGNRADQLRALALGRLGRIDEGFERNALDQILHVPRVAAFSGHMVDAPDRKPPRFPEAKIAAVRKAIAERLDKHRVGDGFSSAARGSDLLFVEALEERGACVSIYLPFPRDDFKKTSMGYGWDRVFDEALKGSKVRVEVLAPALPPEQEQNDAYAACNQRVFEAALKKAQLFDDEQILITVWNGKPGDGAGGTADAVREWKREGHEAEEIDISKL